MDSVTQAVLGASVSGVMLGRYHGRKAYIAGAVLGTLPDLDVIIRYGNPIADMINHRGFSHSVFVLTGLSFLLTWLIRKWPPATQYDWKRLFATLWLIFITHVLADAFTSYGTQLFWPFMPTPTSWSSIFIIDPFFTLPMLLAALAAFAWGSRPAVQKMNAWALGWCVVYLCASLLAKNLVESRVRSTLAQNGVSVDAVFSTPAPFNILLWRVVARTDSDHYFEYVTSVLDDQPREHIKAPLNTALANQFPNADMLNGLRWFSGDWIRYDVIDKQLVATDLRMGLATGYYSFRFRVAQQDANGNWAIVEPSRWPSDRGLEALTAVIARTISASPALPLQQWETRMRAAP
ncbi:metal-dependent hydrolase [Pusillimonas minor]|uniref:Metal-dependent hydrolase n=1 Tax=Pusillimonas minor TaxID=2697024 RepID=A0A842HPU3_9BURK|nr:metal-dependent hydrolase [Pusillimonas minor]MBC2769638.1 metal-dependent hydrolase [Pusillimonas minor]